MFIVLSFDDRYMANFERLADAIEYAKRFPSAPHPSVIEPKPNGYEYQYRYAVRGDGTPLSEKDLAELNVMFSYKYVPVDPKYLRIIFRRMKEVEPEKFEELNRRYNVSRYVDEESGTSDQPTILRGDRETTAG